MPSSLFSTFGNTQRNRGGNSFSNIRQQFESFRSTFTGDPRQQVQQLLNSGKVSQADYDRAVQLARQFQQMIR